jgi:hypothetical protein
MIDPQLPIKGYVGQPATNVELINRNQEAEEQILRILDELKLSSDVDQRWLAIGRTRLEEAYMAINRSISKPKRVEL